MKAKRQTLPTGLQVLDDVITLYKKPNRWTTSVLPLDSHGGKVEEFDCSAQRMNLDVALKQAAFKRCLIAGLSAKDKWRGPYDEACELLANHHSAYMEILHQSGMNQNDVLRFVQDARQSVAK